jgi:pyruvate formate lyase activating enzyme
MGGAAILKQATAALAPRAARRVVWTEIWQTIPESRLLQNSNHDHDSSFVMQQLKENLTDPRIKEAILYEKLGKGLVRCGTCERFCEIAEDKFGFCRTRKNVDGKLYTTVYGDISSVSANPIEKKPFFHFYPGSTALTVGTWSCNFTCPWCQNWELSKSYPDTNRGTYVSPPEFIRAMKRYDCQGTSISFNEPTILLEYALDVFDLAREEAYYNTYVSNGYMSKDSLSLLARHGLDAMNIDVKGDSKAVKRYCNADVDSVWRNAVRAKRLGIHIEITTLVIPGVNDDHECLREMAKRTRSELGRDTPWHLTGYHPAYRFDAPPTPVKTLEKGRDIAMAEGLPYVYMGNVPGHPYENTYCPNCNKLLVERHIFDIKAYHITAQKTCPGCNEAIPIVGSCYKR